MNRIINIFLLVLLMSVTISGAEGKAYKHREDIPVDSHYGYNITGDVWIIKGESYPEWEIITITINKKKWNMLDVIRNSYDIAFNVLEYSKTNKLDYTATLNDLCYLTCYIAKSAASEKIYIKTVRPHEYNDPLLSKMEGRTDFSQYNFSDGTVIDGWRTIKIDENGRKTKTESIHIKTIPGKATYTIKRVETCIYRWGAGELYLHLPAETNAEYGLTELILDKLKKGNGETVIASSDFPEDVKKTTGDSYKPWWFDNFVLSADNTHTKVYIINREKMETEEGKKELCETVRCYTQAYNLKSSSSDEEIKSALGGAIKILKQEEIARRIIWDGYEPKLGDSVPSYIYLNDIYTKKEQDIKACENIIDSQFFSFGI